MSKSSLAASPVVSRTGRSNPIMAGGIAAAAAAASAANAAASTTPGNASNASHHHHHHRLPGSSAGAAGPSASAAAGPSNGQRQQQQLQLQQQADASTSAHHHHHHHHHHHGNNTHAHQHGHAGHAPASASTAAAPHPYPPADATMAMGGPISAAEALQNVNSAQQHHHQPSSHQQHHLAQHGRPPLQHGSSAAATAGPNGLVAWPRVASPSVATIGGKSALHHQPQHAPGSAHPASAGHHPSAGVPGVNGDVGAPQAAPQAPTNEPHNAAIRGILEHGSFLNAEAARAVHFSLERRAAMPTALQQADTETEACYSEIGTIAWNLGDRAKALRAFENALARNPYCLASLQGIARYHYEKANGTNPGAPAGTAAGPPANGSSTAAGAAGASANGGTAKAQPQAAQAAAAAATASLIEEAYNRVVDYAARALAVDENGAEGEMWSVVGHALLQLGQMPRAYSCYQQAIAKAVRKDDPKLWYGIGILYDRYGSVEHAEEAFASVLKLDPNFHKREEVYFRLGIIYKIQGKADASLECFHYILSNPPEPLKAVDVWYQIGHAHELNRNLGLAKEAYEKVLLTTPDHSKVLQHLGGIHLREGQFHDPDLCIQYVTQSLEHDSHDPFTWYLLGRAFMQKQNYGKAYEAYQQAVYRDGKNPAYWCSIGVLYFNINQYHDALDAYTRAVRIHPFIPEIWQNLGTLYESCHDQLADATDAYQRAVQLEPGNVELLHRLEEVRFAMHHGTEIKTPPPIPQDIMPDSKSWAAVHVDVTGAKPVYLDGRIASRQASPAADGGFGLSTFDPHAPPGGHRYVASPANEFGPSAAGPGPYPGGRSSLGPGVNGNRRLSMTRPGSSHAAAYLQQQDYPSDIAPGHPRGYLTPQSQSGLTMANRPSMHSHQSGSSGPHELDRGHPGRPGGPSTRNSGAAYPYPAGGRHSPAGPLDPNARRAMSPNNSPRTRAIEYEMQHQHQRAAHANDNAYERLARAREAEYYERGGMPRSGPGGPATGGPPLRGAGQDGEPGLSPTDHRAPSAYSQREYAAQAGLAGGRRTGSPAGRYADERQAAQGRAGPAARGVPPPPAGYYGQDYYTGSQPPPGYGDPRRDPRYAADGRYDDPRERDIERERHLRPHMDVAARRRAEAESMGKYGGPAGSSASAARNGRRELSPAEYMDREREARRLSGPQHPSAMPSRTANAAGPLDHARLEQGIPMLQKPPSDRRKPYGRQPDGLAGAQAPYGHHPSARPAEYESGNGNDDETDMANALIGLAGGALSSAAAAAAAGAGAAAGSSNAKSDRMAHYGHKRPLSSHGEGPQKRPRPEEMII